MKYLVVAAIAMALAASCIRRGQRGNESYLLADIQGMNEGDENLPGIGYKLQCRSATSYTIEGKRADDTKKIAFPDAAIKVGDECALEITSTATAGKEGPFRWLAMKEGKSVEGLLYSSDLARVEVANINGALTKILEFKLFKTYTYDYVDAFKIAVEVTVEYEDSVQPGVQQELMAGIRCGEGGTAFTESTAKVERLASSKLMAIFSLSAAKMNAQSCSEFYLAVDRLPMYVAPLSKVSFVSPRAGESYEQRPELKFTGFVAALRAEQFGTMKCGSRNDAQACAQIDWNDPLSLWFAVIETDKKEKMIFIPANFRVEGAKVATTSSLLQLLKDGKAKLFPLTLKTTLLESIFNPEALLLSIDGQAVTTIPTQIINIVEAHRHGFKTVPAVTLDQEKATARWFADVEATRSPEKMRFLVSGGLRYFGGKPISSRQSFFDVELYRSNQPPGDQNYRTYTFDKGIPGCSKPLDFYRSEVGARGSAKITEADAEIDACEIKDPAKLAPYLTQDWQLTARFYLWGWHPFVF